MDRSDEIGGEGEGRGGGGARAGALRSRVKEVERAGWDGGKGGEGGAEGKVDRDRRRCL